MKSFFASITKREGQLYLLGGIATLLTAIFSVGHYNYDEHFEVLEFAGYKAGTISSENLTWEVNERITSTLQASIAYIVDQFLKWIGFFNPFRTALLLRLFAAVLSLLGVCMFYRTFKVQLSNVRLQQSFLALSLFWWIGLYHHVRFSSEGLCSSLLLIGFSIYFSHKGHKAWILIAVGCILGLAFCIRYPIGLMLLGFTSWLILVRRKSALNIIYILVGLSISLCISLVVDAWFYGEFTITPWNYFVTNILHDKGEIYSSAPWWFYLYEIFIVTIPPFSLAYIVAFFVLLLKEPKSPIVWIIVPFLLVLFAIEYKVIGMLIPLIGFVPFILIKTLDILYFRITKPRVLQAFTVFIKLFWFVNIIVAICVMVLPAASQIGLYRKLYFSYPEEALLFYTAEHGPYYMGWNIYYYKRPELTVQFIQKNTQIVVGDSRTTLLALRGNEKIESLNYKSTLIYSSIPNWLQYFNFNNWVDRSATWRIYELHSL